MKPFHSLARSWIYLPVLALVPLTHPGCDQEPSREPGSRVSVSVAPLRLPGIIEACYDLTVTNAPGGAGETVWTQTGICSSRYGDAKGAISYVGPCDASVPEKNTVILELVSMADADGPAEFVNPCGTPHNAPCKLEARCEPNRDTPVEFNLTIMRPARQGFFDVAVNFEDVFCSAKLDCEYEDERPIELLFHPDTGRRAQTAVIALACTGGAGDASDTVLHLDTVKVTCDGQAPTLLDPTVGPGNAWTDDTPDPNPTDAVWQYATYRGRETLECAGGDCNKVYWNIAVGFDPARDCVISTSATASSGDSMAVDETMTSWTPAKTTYPYIQFSAALSDEGERVCGRASLDGDAGEVRTYYTGTETARPFCHRFDGVETMSCVDASASRYVAAVCNIDGLCACVRDDGGFDWMPLLQCGNHVPFDNIIIVD